MKRFALFTILLLSLSLFACNKNNDLTQESEGGENKEIFLSLDGDTNLVFPPAGGVVSFSVTAKKPWKAVVSNNANWVTIDNSMGINTTQTMKITVNRCTTWQSTEKKQHATIKLVDVNTYDVFTVIDIEQFYPYRRIEWNGNLLDNTYFTHTYEWYNCTDNATDPGTVEMVIESNVDWTISNIPSWLPFSQTSFSPVFDFKTGTFSSELENKIKLTPNAYNVTNENLSKTVTIQFGNSTLGKQSNALSLNQEHLEFEVTPDSTNPAVTDSEFDVEFAPCNNSSDIYKFNITTPRSWKILQYPNWVYCPSVAGSNTATNFSLSPQGVNSYENERVHTLAVLCNIDTDYTDDQLPKRELKIRQREYVLTTSETKLEFDNEGNGSQAFSINSSGAWSLELPTSASWLQVDGNAFSGVGHEYLEDGVSEDTAFTCSIKGGRNYNETANSAIIELKSTEEGVSLSKRVEVTQAGYQLEAVGLPTATVGVNQSEYSLSIISSGKWEIKSNVSWVTFSQNSGNGNADITCTVDKNTTSSDRKATITLVSKTHAEASKELQKTYQFTQQKFVFEVDKTQLAFEPIDKKTQTINIKCSANWSISSSQSWVNVSYSNGSATGASGRDIEVSVDDYLQTSGSRNCTLTISNDFDSSNKKIITVTQNKFEFTVELASGQSTTVNAAATSTDYSDMRRTFSVISSSGNWGVATGTGFSVSSDKKTVTFDYNPNASTRTLSVKIHPIYNGSLYTSISKSITFTQAGLEFDKTTKSMSVETPVMNEANVVLAQDDFLNEFKSSGVCVVRYINNANNWLKLVDGSNKEVGNGALISGDLRGYKVQIKDNNLSSNSRSGEIQICLAQSGNANTYAVYKSIKVTQQGITIIPTLALVTGECQSLSFGKKEETKEISVDSDFGWKVSLANSTSVDWITLNPASGNSGDKFEVKVTANTTGDVRYATIYVESEYYATTKDPNLRKEISVTQSGN